MGGRPNPWDLGWLDRDPWREPFHPPTYGDWWEGRDDQDDRDEISWHDRNPWTGLPPRNHHGFEYEEVPFPLTNGDGGTGEWIHENRRVPRHANGTSRRKQFVWPSDGKRKGTWGRWKDLMEGKGPDIYVAGQNQRPSRDEWKNRIQDDFIFNDAVRPAHRFAKRAGDKHYDFRTRRYRRDYPDRVNWADAIWPRWDADQYDHPLAYRCEHGDWYNLSWAPFGGVRLPMYTTKRERKERRGLWK
ncbi:hypothetical protein EJ08DRAFT_404064 [Tothia fuscella]|uniref:Uncharacterized protein n=1 Tax=Tothia fuscella TaxID=1048955 RepID=A0A9P4NKD8_9PEZI|nr:hypothetical protein EJ08DRAFT_404064 [Tothia fuscella]